MSESFPNPSYGPEPGNNKGKDRSAKKDKTAGSRFEPLSDMTPSFRPQIEKSAGDMSLKLGEGLFQPLDKHQQSESPADNAEASDVHRNDERPAEQESREEPERWRQVSAEELAVLAARAEQAQFEAMRLEQKLNEEKTDKDVPVKKTPADNIGDLPTKVSDRVQSDTFDTILERNIPEMADATSGEQLGDDSSDYTKATSVGVPAPDIESIPKDNQDQLSREGVAFSDFVSGHPELTDLAAVQLPEAPAGVVSPERPSSDDDVFRDMARQETGDDPGAVRYRDVEPGRPPVVDAGGGESQPPANLPTFEGSPYGGNNAWRAPAGGLTDPVTLAALSALEARQRLNSLRHTVAEVGLAGGEAALAGAVGILGLGLVAEHFRAKHREKKLDKKIHKQQEQLRRTDQSLQEEQTRHHRTREQLERLTATHTRSAEEHHRFRENNLSKTEARVGFEGAGLLSAAAAAELAARARERKVQAPEVRPLTAQELNRQIIENPELATVLARTPETQKVAEQSSATMFGDGFRHESRHERQPGMHVGTTVPSHEQGTAIQSVTDISLPRPQQPAPHSVPSEAKPLKSDVANKKSKLTSPWLWAVTAVILAALIIGAFAL